MNYQFELSQKKNALLKSLRSQPKKKVGYLSPNIDVKLDGIFCPCITYTAITLYLYVVNEKVIYRNTINFVTLTQFGGCHV